MKREGFALCALLETQWPTAPDIDGVVVYSLPKTKTSQGAALLVAADVTSSGFESMGDRMMGVTLGEGKERLRVFAFHAPHSGKEETELSEWWMSAADFVEKQSIPGVPTIGLGDANATLVPNNVRLTRSRTRDRSISLPSCSRRATLRATRCSTSRCGSSKRSLEPRQLLRGCGGHNWMCA